MAVDTANKRASLMSLGRPFVPRLPRPDGGFTTAGDRAQLEYRYTGIVQASEGGALYKPCHQRSGKHPLAAQSDVPQLYMKIG